MVQPSTRMESVLRKDRRIVIAGIILVALLAWSYLFYLAGDMQRNAGNGSMPADMEMAISQVRVWGLMDLFLMFIMWSVMMTAMMVPTAAPMILTFANINRRRREQRQPFVSTGVFLMGYVMVWSVFAAAATLAQWGLNAAALLTPMMASANPFLGGSLLIAAGLFQWSPLKYACLNHCRTPLGFIMTEWRDGPRGALIMGWKHGFFCLGCCWVLMCLLFVLGVMNLLWIAALAAFMLIEKVAPGGQWISRISGLLLVGWGAWLMLRVVVQGYL